MNDGRSHILEFVFTVGHIEVYKEKQHEAYYWKFFDEDKFHGAFLSLQTCMSNYENVVLSNAGMQAALDSTMMNEPVCPVIQQNSPDNNVIFIDFFQKKRSFT